MITTVLWLGCGLVERGAPDLLAGDLRGLLEFALAPPVALDLDELEFEDLDRDELAREDFGSAEPRALPLELPALDLDPVCDLDVGVPVAIY